MPVTAPRRRSGCTRAATAGPWRGGGVAAVGVAEYMTGEVVVDDPVKLRQCEVVYGALQVTALPVAESLSAILKAREKFDG